MASFKAQDGSSIKDGDVVRLRVQKGGSELELQGVMHAFDHVERVYDGEGIAVGKTSELRWELLTGDPHHPAIGLLPEHVLTLLKG